MIRTLRSVATGFMWAGTLGGLHASNSAANRILVVQCRYDGATCTTLFACTDIGARTFLDGWQRDFQIAGLKELPPVQSVARSTRDTEQLALLQEISAKLDRLINALEKPA